MEEPTNLCGVIDQAKEMIAGSDIKVEVIETGIKVNITVLDNKLTPVKNFPTDSGFDVFSNMEDFTLNPLDRCLVSTGVSLQLPTGYDCQVRPRSGNAAKLGITVLNTPGTIDQTYTGEIKVILINLGTIPIKIQKYSKIAQLVFSQVLNIKLCELELLLETDRGANGFGSSGTI